MLPKEDDKREYAHQTCGIAYDTDMREVPNVRSKTKKGGKEEQHGQVCRTDREKYY